MSADGQEFYIEPDAVRRIGGQLDEISEFCTGTVRILDSLLTQLKSNAFVGLVGGAVWIAFIEMIKPYIENLAKKLNELSGDVTRAADLHEGKSVEASRFFTTT